MKDIHYHAAVAGEQGNIEEELRACLNRMEDVTLAGGGRIHAGDIVGEMHTLDPDKFTTAVFLCDVRNEQHKQRQGLAMMSELRQATINHVVRKHGAAIYKLAAARVEGGDDE
mgnify:CR=1 FL=1